MYVQNYVNNPYCPQICILTFHFLSNQLYFCCNQYLFSFLLSAVIFSRWNINFPNGNLYKYQKSQMNEWINKNPFLQHNKSDCLRWVVGRHTSNCKWKPDFSVLSGMNKFFSENFNGMEFFGFLKRRVKFILEISSPK